MIGSGGGLVWRGGGSIRWGGGSSSQGAGGSSFCQFLKKHSEKPLLENIGKKNVFLTMRSLANQSTYDITFPRNFRNNLRKLLKGTKLRIQIKVAPKRIEIEHQVITFSLKRRKHGKCFDVHFSKKWTKFRKK